MQYKFYQLGKMQLCYMTDEEKGHISMNLLPMEVTPKYEERRKWLDVEETNDAWDVGNLCHLSLRHHPQGNGAGGTLKYGESVQRLRFVKQEKEETENTIRIITKLSSDEYSVFHIVTYTKGEDGIEVESVFQNETERVLTLELFTSFSLDNLSPLQESDGAYALYLHRFHGGWSLEGQHQEDSIEQMNLGGAWFRAFPESERYGSVGSFPVTRWFPFGAVEDRQNGIFWAAQLGINSSWQMELSRDGDCYSLSGGIGDYETSSWWKDISPGTCFQSPKAYLSVGKSLESVCQNITGMFQKYVDDQPQREADLPIWFNEWCTSWGNPTHQSVIGLKESLQGLPIAGVVIDAGWSVQPEDAEPQGGNGDWVCDPRQFPNGLKAVSRELKKEQWDTGVWMEFEVTTEGAKVHQKDWDALHLKRNGELIQTGYMRRFWDFRKPEVIAYLKEKVIAFLQDNEIGYLKVDYNGSIGMGCDGAESLGEGLRSQMQAVYEFFCLIRKELPDLVIENCASGGHRLEPLMMSITALSSFSDAHECPEIPYIAANLHYLILPRQSLIWAVIRPNMTMREIYYRMISSLLGRMCLSGDIAGLTQEQRQVLAEGCDFYRKCTEVIKCGRSHIIRNCTNNPRHLKGYQAVIRTNQKEMLVVFHSFEIPEKEITIPLPEAEWKVVETFGEEKGFEITGNSIRINDVVEWNAYAILFEKI